MIPYASSTVDIILHADCPIPKKGDKDGINLLKARVLNWVVEAVVQISPECYRLTSNQARQMHAFSNQNFFVHGKPVDFKSISTFNWLYISRLSYGIPDEPSLGRLPHIVDASIRLNLWCTKISTRESTMCS